MSTPTDDKSIEPGLTHSSAGDLLDPADCLACCYDYTKKLDGYITLSISLEDLYACKERRARILDMARIATTRTNCEIVRLMLETELEMSEDPLDDKGHTRSLPKGAEMCRMQSFLFHRHLAQIYAHQNDGTISMQKHLDIARNFSDAFDTYGTDSIDLWTLLFLVQDKKYSQIPKELLGSLQWDHESYGLNIEHCLRYCWGILNPTKSLYDAFAVYTASIVYDAEQRTKTEPTEISDLVLEDSSFSLWKRSSILFTFLMQLTHGALFWMSGHPTISPAHILMIVSRMIVKRSSITSKHPDNLKEPEGHPLQIHPTSLKIYCDTILELLQYHYMRPNTKIEFVTQFLAHHTWYPASDSKRALASQTQSNPLEALKSVLAIRRDDFTADHLSTILEDWTPSSKSPKEKRVISTVSELSRLLGEHQGQRDLPNRRPADSHIQDRQFPPSSYSSGKLLHLTSLSSHDIYLDALKANPTMTRSLASRSSCSSQRSYSSSLQRFKAAALSR